MGLTLNSLLILKILYYKKAITFWRTNLLKNIINKFLMKFLQPINLGWKGVE